MLFLLMLETPYEESLFENIYNTYNRRIFAICYHYVGDFYDAEELTQSVFFKAAENIKRLKYYSERHTKAFLYTVAKHLSVNHLEMKSARPKVYHVRDSDGMEPPEFERRIASEDSVERIKNIMNSLPPEQRDIIIMFYINEMTSKEIAKVLDLKETTVKNRISRAKQIIQKKIKEEGLDE